MPVKRFRSEGPVLYGRYQFGYCEWVELDALNELGAVYAGGYLPYSAAPADPRHLFYMARSLRVDLAGFAMDKKRRYDHRVWEAFGLRRVAYPKAEFLGTHGGCVHDRAQEWMEARFGQAFLSGPRLAYILAKPFLTDVLAWFGGDALTAFALVVRGEWGAHYWYVFYRNGAPREQPPGHGYLIDFLQWARAAGLPHAYLGTAYGRKSCYKSRGLAGIEFWDGNRWDADKARLAALQAADDAPDPA